MPGRNPAAAIRYGTRHQKRRQRDLARLRPGTPCPQIFHDGTICGQPMWPATQQLQLGHAPSGGYLGMVHAACNERDGAERKALAEGKTLRRRRCEHCGQPYRATRREQRTCGQPACIAAIRRGRQLPLPLTIGGRPW